MSYTSYDLTIRQIVHEAHRCSREHGWWDGQRGTADALDADRVLATVPEKLCLIHSEVSEALEDYRTRNFGNRRDEKGKPVGFDSELADIVIRIADLAGAMGIDLEAAILDKMRFNESRPFRHGGRTC